MAEKPPKIPGNDGTVYKCSRCKKVLLNMDVPTFPFCSDQCRLLDLNAWVEGEYKVTRPVDPSDQLEEMERGSETIRTDRLRESK